MGGNHKQFAKCDNCFKKDFLVNVADRLKGFTGNEDWCDECIEEAQEKVARKEQKLGKAMKTIKKFMAKNNMTFEEVEEMLEEESED